MQSLDGEETSRLGLKRAQKRCNDVKTAEQASAEDDDDITGTNAATKRKLVENKTPAKGVAEFDEDNKNKKKSTKKKAPKEGGQEDQGYKAERAADPL
jgi:hypothetical protein